MHRPQSRSESQRSVLMSECAAARGTWVVASDDSHRQLRLDCLHHVPLHRANHKDARHLVLVCHTRGAKKAALVSHKGEDGSLLGFVHDEPNNSRHEEDFSTAGNRLCDALLAPASQNPQKHGQTTLEEVIAQVADRKAARRRSADRPRHMLDVPDSRLSPTPADDVDK